MDRCGMARGGDLPPWYCSWYCCSAPRTFRRRNDYVYDYVDEGWIRTVRVGWKWAKFGGRRELASTWYRGVDGGRLDVEWWATEIYININICLYMYIVGDPGVA